MRVLLTKPLEILRFLLDLTDADAAADDDDVHPFCLEIVKVS